MREFGVHCLSTYAIPRLALLGIIAAPHRPSQSFYFRGVALLFQNLTCRRMVLEENGFSVVEFLVDAPKFGGVRRRRRGDTPRLRCRGTMTVVLAKGVGKVSVRLLVFAQEEDVIFGIGRNICGVSSSPVWRRHGGGSLDLLFLSRISFLRLIVEFVPSTTENW